MGIKIEASAYNTIGGRKNNEDNFYLNGTLIPREQMDKGGKKTIRCEDSIQLYAVFDGMGGGEHGEIASFYAASQLREYQANSEHIDNSEYLRDFLTATSKGIDKMSIEHGLRSGACGSTAAILVIGDWWYRTAHVGDSRIYLLRDGNLSRVTKDQSEVQRLVDAGKITLDEAWSHVRKNVITHHLGMPLRGSVLNSIISERKPLQEGDRFLICSDGVNDSLRDKQIAELMAAQEGTEARASHIVYRAVKSAGEMGVSSDNVTAIVVDVQAVDGKAIAEKRLKRLRAKHAIATAGAVLFGLGLAASLAMLGMLIF